MPYFAVFTPSHPELFEDIPTERPGVGPPKSLRRAGMSSTGRGLNEISDDLAEQFIVVSAASADDAMEHFVAVANAAVDTNVQTESEEELLLEFWHEQSRPVGAYWKISYGLYFVHAVYRADPAEPPSPTYEVQASGENKQIFAPLIVRQI